MITVAQHLTILSSDEDSSLVVLGSQRSGLVISLLASPLQSVRPSKVEITDVRRLYCTDRFMLVCMEWLSGSNQLNAPTVKFNPDSTRKDNWVGHGFGQTVQIDHPLGFNPKIYFLNCSIFW